MKVKIIRVKEHNGNCYFAVKIVKPDGYESNVKCFSFRENEPEDSIWNEANEFAAALATAHLLETGIAISGETVVYETPAAELTQVDASLKELP